MVGAVGAILVASFSQPNLLEKSLIALCAYIITFPANEMLLGNMRRTWRISTYMRVFLETEDALKYIKWETRLNDQRLKAQNEKVESSYSSLLGRNEWLLTTLLNSIVAIIALISLTLYAWEYYEAWIANEQAYFPRGLYFSCFLVLLIFVLNIILYVYNTRQEIALRRLGKVENSFHESWSKIKDSLSH
jgi:uncharacterized membrane protein